MGDALGGHRGLNVTLSAAGTTDQDGDAIASYRWDFEGDGVVDSTAATPSIVHTYGAGVYNATVVAVDARGLASAPVSAEVRSADPPNAVASVPKHGKSGIAVAFDASASTDPVGSALVYRFDFGDGTSITTTSSSVSHA